MLFIMTIIIAILPNKAITIDAEEDHVVIVGGAYMAQSATIIGFPVETGAPTPGCDGAPAAMRDAGLASHLRSRGWDLNDCGDVRIGPQTVIGHKNRALRNLAETIAWIETIAPLAYQAAAADLAIFLGGDHSVAAGTLPGVAQYAAELEQPLFVLWLDAHPDLHSLSSTKSGNLHGTPAAYFTGQKGFEAYPPIASAVRPENVLMLGLRSIDPPERALLTGAEIAALEMPALSKMGVRECLLPFLNRVREANGRLHVSFDVDFLDPNIAPAVGTPVEGGATFDQAAEIMELVAASRLMTSLDIVELNPLLDASGQTTNAVGKLVAKLIGDAATASPFKPQDGQELLAQTGLDLS